MEAGWLPRFAEGPAVPAICTATSAFAWAAWRSRLVPNVEGANRASDTAVIAVAGSGPRWSMSVGSASPVSQRSACAGATPATSTSGPTQRVNVEVDDRSRVRIPSMAR